MKTILFILLLIQTLEKADVYFTKEISSSKMVEMLKKLNLDLSGKVGLKIHSGEPGGLYFLKPDFLQEIYDYTNGTFLECNTAYSSVRSDSTTHKQLLEQNGWTKNNRRIVIMDEDPTKDDELTVKYPEKITKNYVGEHMKEYNMYCCIIPF